MKKRVFAIITVIVFAFSSFCLVVHAAGEDIVIELLFDAFQYAYETGDYSILFGVGTHKSYLDLTPEEAQDVLVNYNHSLQAQKEKVGDSPASAFSTIYEQYDAYDNHVYFNITRSNIVDWCQQYHNFDCSDYNIFCYGEHTWYTDRRRLSDGCTYIEYFTFYLFPKNANVYYSDDGTNFTIEGPWRTKVSFKKFSIVLHCTSDLVAYCDKYGYLVNTSEEIRLSNPLDNIFVNDLTEQPLIFTSKIRVNPSGSVKTLEIILDSNKPVPHEMFAFGGILYDDGSERYDGTDRGFINSNYVDAQSLQGESHWHWIFDLDSFAEWACRKHILDTQCFYGFVAVHSGGSNDHFTSVYYADELHLDISDPSTGIFSDVEDMPQYPDYKPVPVPFPTFPDFSFDYTPSNNYYTYNYDTVNNWDDNSQTFNEWASDTFTTINNNIAGGLDSIDKNINEFEINVKNYFDAVDDFIDDGYSAVNEYLGDLIIKFNNDFLGWTDSFGRYLGDLFQTLNDNLNIIADNIIKAIQIQTIPDKENVLDICEDNIPLFDDFKNLFSDHDVSDSDLIIAIPYLSNDNANGVELVTLSSASPTELRSSAVGDTRSFDPVMTPYLEGYYIVNISGIFRNPQYDFGRFRTVSALIISGSTIFALFNITLKCFGMHFGALAGDDLEKAQYLGHF